jgi:hypothetical protein
MLSEIAPPAVGTLAQRRKALGVHTIFPFSDVDSTSPDLVAKLNRKRSPVAYVQSAGSFSGHHETRMHLAQLDLPNRMSRRVELPQDSQLPVVAGIDAPGRVRNSRSDRPGTSRLAVEIVLEHDCKVAQRGGV